ncbi:exopolysaccharide Pel transporter PelG [Salinisphaera aquimarina]|uniref:Exopolysaccharide Pel transporter PelG n=1 Tax=Salinisphaera aquimarina TaxID=2094031 RepID=A0ABV7ESA6_9GAMM
MAGIGFELRKLLRKDSYFGLLRAYGYAGIISSGPWVLSILVIMALGFLSLGLLPDQSRHVTQFLVSVTYIVAASLVLSGLAQLIFTRFVADRLFEKKDASILPNLIGLLTLVNVTAAGLGLVILITLFDGTTLLYRVEMFVGFVLLTNIWCITVFVTGMKAYRQVLWAFVFGYGVTFVLGMALRGYNLEGLLGGFVVGQGVLFYTLLFLVLRYYPGDRMFAFDLRRADQTYRSLIFTGLFYNLGIWADKFLFWYNPATSEHVIGPLRASPIYDFPIFLAYLSIVPGMAVFLIRMETDFAERYDAFYGAVRGGDTLAHIEQRLDRMVDTVRQGIYDIFKIQGITVVSLLLVGPALINWLGFSPYYVPLFNIDIVAVGMQVLFMAILNVLFYLDKLRLALVLCLFFFVANVLLTLLSQYLGAIFYGYGFALSLMLSSLAGLAVLDREFQSLTYQTFMLQRQG